MKSPPMAYGSSSWWLFFCSLDVVFRQVGLGKCLNMHRTDCWQEETQQSLVQPASSVENLTQQGRSLPYEGGQMQKKEEVKPQGNR